MGLNVKFSTVAKAIISTTGNTCVVNYNSSSSSSGAMITPTGRLTRDWKQNGSKAYLNIKKGSTIRYAELVWYSTVKQEYYADIDLIDEGEANNPVKFSFPSGHIENISPGSGDDDIQDFSEEDEEIIHRYRSVDVTNIMKKYSETGMYTVEKIPTSVPSTDIGANTRCGWTLIVVYENPSFKMSVISLYTGLVFVLSRPLDIQLGNFSTPSTGIPRGLLTVVAADGDTILYPNTFSVGPDFSKLTEMGNSVNAPNKNPGTAPNNPKNNFLAGQINIADPTDSNVGLIDTRGTLGKNNNNAFVPKLFQGARCKWDITCVNFSNTLRNDQTTLAIRCNNKGGGESDEILAAGIIIEARSPNLNVEKLVNKTETLPGDELQYTITIDNKGDVTAQDVIIIDPIEGGEYVDGSLIVDNIPHSGNIQTGVNIGDVKVEESTIVSFKVKVVANAPNIITNQANVKCKFIPSADQELQEAIVYSNETYVKLHTPSIDLQKSANRNTILVGDVVTFTITALNSGTLGAQNVTITEELPSSLKFVPKSIIIGTTSQPEMDLTNPISIGNININESQVLEFKAEVVQIPSSGDITNDAICDYTYEIGTSPSTTGKGSSISNTYVLTGKKASMLIHKIANRKYVTVGDILTYRINIRNNGNIVADNTRFIDALPPELKFKPGTFSVSDDSTVPSTTDPTTGVYLGTFDLARKCTITFDAELISLPTDYNILNTATIQGDFTVESGVSVVQKQFSHNTRTGVKSVDLTIEKTSNRTIVTQGDTITYTVNIRNTGTASADSIMFTDILNENTPLESGSLMINGVAPDNPDFTTGIDLGKLDPGSSVEVKYKVKVGNEYPSGELINTAKATGSFTIQSGFEAKTKEVTANTTVQVKSVDLTIEKTSNRTIVTQGNTITYTVDIKNNGNVVADNTRFIDILPPEVKFKPGTFSVSDDSTVPSTTDPTTGVYLGTFGLTRKCTITFDAELISLPTDYNILNTATIQGDFTVEPGVKSVPRQFSYNNTVEVKSTELTIEKTSNRTIVTQGDTIIYTVNIRNTGTASADSIMFTDILNENTPLVEGSLMINGVVQNNPDLTTGVGIGKLDPGSSVEVKYKVKVGNEYPSGELVNTAKATGSFTIQSGFEAKTKEVTASTTVQVKSVDLTIEKTSNRTIVTQGDTIIYTINIENTGTAKANNVVFKDELNKNTILVPKSFTINGKKEDDSKLTTGANLGPLNPGSSVKVQYEVNVENAYSAKTLIDTATATGIFIIQSRFLVKIKEVTASTTVQVKNTILNVQKASDKIIVETKDIITYTILIKNVGDISARKVIFTDKLNSNVNFIPDSLTINNEQKTGINPNDEIDLGTLNINDSIIISFKIMVNENFIDLQLTNTADVKGIFMVETKFPEVSKEFSDINTIDIKNIGLDVQKSSDKLTATQGDIIIYKVVIRNTGIVDAEEIIFTDELNLFITFIENSFTLNDVAIQDVNPSKGINLGRLDVNGTITVTFKIRINADFPDRQLINIASIQGKFILDPSLPPVVKKFFDSNIINIKRIDLTIEKSSNTPVAIPGDIVNYKVIIKNTGDVPAKDILFIDNLNLYTKFIKDSLSVDGIIKYGENPNNGIKLGTLDVNDIVIIMFKIKIDENFPDNNLINWVNIESEFIIDTMLPKVFRKFTNRNVINIRRIDLSLIGCPIEIIARKGDIITYKIHIKNNGTIPADEIIFQYYFNLYTVFIESSIIVNDVAINTMASVVDGKQDKKNGIDYVELNLGLLDIENTMNILFKVKVIKNIPINGIYHMVKIRGNFSLMPYIQPITKIFEIIFKINPYLQTDCIMVNKVFSHCEKRFCVKNIEVDLQGKYIFKNIKFKSAQLEESTLKITPLEDRPSFSRVQFVAKVPYEIIVNLIDSKEEKVFNKVLPDLYVDIIMFCSKTRNEFKYKIVLESVSKLITKAIIQNDKLKFSVGVILVNKLIGNIQLSILSNGMYLKECKCEEYKSIEKPICNEFEKYKYKDFFDV